MIPSQKLGIDWRKSEAMRLTWSATRPRCVAETTPSGTASTVERNSAAAASSTVAGQKCSITMRIAGRFSRIDAPKSPRTAAPTKSTYCVLVDGEVEREPHLRVDEEPIL